MNELEFKSYPHVLAELKQIVKQARQKAVFAANEQMLKLYWNIGQSVAQQAKENQWGAKIIEKLANDLRSEFPDMKGFSFRNVKYMRQFAEFYTISQFGQQAVAQIPWGHHVLIIDKVKDQETALYYIYKTLENGWSRDVLSLQIKSALHLREGKAISNFEQTTLKENTDLISQTFKDPYVFDFLTMSEGFQEKDLENALTEHITKFLLELGAGFAFVGKQYHLEVGEQDFYVDLLFYNVKLHAYIVIELKKGNFKPEYAGQLNFYLSVIDDKLKTNLDQPTIGLLLCQDKNKVVAEYALKDINKPMGVSTYQITESIPENLKGSFPTIEEIENELTQHLEWNE